MIKLFGKRITMSLRVVIEEFDSKVDRVGFFLDPIPWKWTVYRGNNMLGFGYTYTEEEARINSNIVLNNSKVT